MKLYRPVGLAELALIFDAEMRAFPPRLPEQPIFYPVLNEDYATQIARDWNPPDAKSQFAGYVTEFEVDPDYALKFPKKVVGASVHEEIWVPAAELTEFNRRISNRIVVKRAFFGPEFVGYVPTHCMLKGKSSKEQFVGLVGISEYNGMDFILEVVANRKAVFLNYPFWRQFDCSGTSISIEQKARVLNAIGKVWTERWPQIALCN